MEGEGESAVAVEIPPQLRAYVPTALLKTSVQYPSLRFMDDDGVVSIRGAVSGMDDELRKSIIHAVYREKIYAETLSMRQALVAAVTTL